MRSPLQTGFRERLWREPMFDTLADLSRKLMSTGYFIDPVMTRSSSSRLDCKSRSCSKDRLDRAKLS
jgi:hypothetical protein